MIAVRLEEDLEKRLEHLSHETGQGRLSFGSICSGIGRTGQKP